LRSGGRYIFAYGTGVGKTPTAIVAMTRFLEGRKQPRILVVCPAIVRRHWQAEFGRWAALEAKPIEMGRRRATGSKAALRARDEAYAASIQIVSYDLLPEVTAEGWDGLIFDEIHHLGDYGSKQSRIARALLAANPGVPALGLSATLVPTHVHQLWHPLHLLWPGDWGRPPRTGNIPWQFVAKYQDILDDGYGKRPGPARQDRVDELHARLDEVAHRLVREDIAADLPAVDARALELPGHGLDRGLHMVGKVRQEVVAAGQWFEALPPDITHAVILCYHRQLAADIQHKIVSSLPRGWSVIGINGQDTTAKRVEALAQAEDAPRCVVVATSESIREGIRLMWAQRVLFAEWRQSPKQVIQTLGRFQSVGDTRRPQIDVLTDESLREKAAVLMQRIEDINGIMKAGSTEDKIATVFGPKAMTPERMASATQAMLAARAQAFDPDWVEDEVETDAW
jgi:hypothetical protein